jgi:plastocyanin
MRKLAILFATFALVFVACSQNEEPALEGSPPPEATSTAAAINDKGTKTFTTQDVSLELELDNFYFEPTFIKLPGGSKVKLELFNEGSVAHTFTSEALGVDEELQPDARKEIEVDIGTETQYEFHCRFHGDQGMRGAFMPH